MLNDNMIALTNIHTVNVVHKRKIVFNIISIIISLIIIVYMAIHNKEFISKHKYTIFGLIIFLIIAASDVGIVILLDKDNKIVKNKSYISLLALITNIIASVLFTFILVYKYIN